jgi:hypothetical protein
VVAAAEVSSTLPTQQASPPSSAPLPSTGDNVLGTVRAALLLIALGAGLAVAGRRSRRGRREGGAR